MIKPQEIPSWERNRHFWKQGIMALLAFFMFGLTKGYAQDTLNDSKDFSMDNPVVYEDAWDLWPYTFLEDGEPTGYNVELIKMIFEELGWPYEIKLKDTQKALEDLKNGKSDVMMGIKAPFHDAYGKYGNIVLNLFTHSVVYAKSEKQPILTFNDLARNRVIVHKGSFSHYLMQGKGWDKNAIPYNDMKEAVLQVSTEGEGIIVWNTMSLKWLLNQYHADNLEIKPIDMPHGEYRFMSNNPKLLAMMDSAYAVLRADDRLQELQNKWFYPERKSTGIPSWVWMIANTLVVFLFGILGLYIFYTMRYRRVTRNIKRENARLALTLEASKVRIWIYDIKQQTVTWLDQNGNKKHEYTVLEFFSNYASQDMEKMLQALKRITSQEVETVELTMNVPSDVDNNDMHDYAISLAVFHRDRNGKPTVIIGTHNDISEDRLRQNRVKDTLIIYQAIFDSVMIDMVYFDKNGYLMDLNDKACHTFGCKREDILNKDIHIFDFYGLKEEDIPQDKSDSFYATIRLKIPFDSHVQKTILYELKIQPLYGNAKEGLQGIYGTGREVTDISNYYHQRKEGLQQLSQANKEVSRYINNINYALKVGGMRFVIYHPSTHIMSIYSTIKDIQQQLTQTRAIHLLEEKSRKQALKLFMSMDDHTAEHIDITLKTTLKRPDGQPLYVQLLLIPSVYNNNEYFGICRDVSEQKNTEVLLEKETEKAQEVETIKNAFLHNMNYEIRTPLNSIVGFADFFQLPHTPEDEAVFVEQIKNNSSSLLELINNILFLSRIDAGMIEIKSQFTDFALSFDSMCNTYWGNNQQRENVSFIVENHYNHMVLDIDVQNIGFILEQLIKNAKQFTEKGSIHTHYDYTGDQLIVAVEDTGCGIAPEMTDHLFERFATGANNGTGLGLSICHELIRLMNGSINIKSTEDKGTTVWFAIPCKAKEIERKSIS